MALRAYEAMIVLDATLDDDAVAGMIAKLDEGIVKLGGSIERHEKQGRKKLAYTVNKKTEGFYLLTHLQFPSDRITELNRMFQLTENLIRHMVTVRYEKPAKPEARA